jgi:hypothetical protein
MNHNKLENAIKTKITDILNELDVPVNRKAIDQPENIRWLVRNLHIRNYKHPQFNLCFALIIILNEAYK